MKKSSWGLIAGIGIGVTAGIAVGYLNTPKYRYFDKVGINEAKDTANDFLTGIASLNGNGEMMERQLEQLLDEYVIDYPYYRAYVKQLIEQMHQYQVVTQPVKRVKECLYLLKDDMDLSDGTFKGYPLYVDEGRYLMDHLTPSKDTDLHYYRFSEGLYRGCYGTVVGFKVNKANWYLRLAYLDYGFKVLDFGVMNSRYQSLIK